ncbi:MAG: hypothetical protein JXB13_22125 [Phycisphaerae bacterium]|nr:hypothetical protein [Phycisphaerae bacterium]
MANVTVTCRKFPGAYAATNGTRPRDVSRRAVLRAVVTVGAQRFLDVFSVGWRGLLHRFGMGLSAFSFLEQSPTGLCLSSRYGSLDASEKGASTYWYGMALAKITADVELGVHWLAHVDQMRDSGALTITSSTNERGDLVGRDIQGAWHVIEAKGRSNSYSASLVTKAKRQAATVTSVNGQPPSTTSACITSLFTQPISVLLDDPSASEEGAGERWRIPDEDFFRQYYRGIIEYLRELGPRREQMLGSARFVTVPLFPFFWEFFHYLPPPPFVERPLELGLLAAIYEMPERASEAVRELPRDDRGYAGTDGIAIFGPMRNWESAKE